jgi:hypothetical protein
MPYLPTGILGSECRKGGAVLIWFSLWWKIRSSVCLGKQWLGKPLSPLPPCAGRRGKWWKRNGADFSSITDVGLPWACLLSPSPPPSFCRSQCVRSVGHEAVHDPSWGWTLSSGQISQQASKASWGSCTFLTSVTAYGACSWSDGQSSLTL